MTQDTAEDANPHALISGRRYRKLLITTALSASLVSVVPLLIMAGVSNYQYRDAFRAEITRPMVRFAANGKQSLESFLTAHLSALDMVLRERPYGELRDPETLSRILGNLKQAFGGYVDLGVVDNEGFQVAYAGPFELEGLSYSDHNWFREVSTRGVSVSDVFMGYRELPHFVIAIQADLGPGQVFVLRATIDTDVIDRLALSLV